MIEGRTQPESMEAVLKYLHERGDINLIALLKERYENDVYAALVMKIQDAIGERINWKEIMRQVKHEYYYDKIIQNTLNNQV